MWHLFLDVLAFVSMEYVIERTVIVTRRSVDMYRGKKHDKEYRVRLEKVTCRQWIWIDRK